MSRSSSSGSCTVGDFASAMEEIAPTVLAQSWDNVGLLLGDRRDDVSRVLLSVDLTPAVVEEAVGKNIDLVVSYHPPIFRPIQRLGAPGGGVEAVVLRCAREGLSIYSPHTALDAAAGGTNDVLAELAGALRVEPLEWAEEASAAECKLVVFVPREAVESVANALYESGAGRIGDYTHCGFRLEGRGTFLGGETTKPVIGERGRLEMVEEVRLETVVPARALPKVVGALRAHHPYEEPAFDIYPLKGKPIGGIGRVGFLERSIPLGELARSLREAVGASRVHVVGAMSRPISRVIVVAGAAGGLPFEHSLGAEEAIVTGEMRHHDALTVERVGCGAIVLGHWWSERPALSPLAERLERRLPGVQVCLSEADRDPFMMSL